MLLMQRRQLSIRSSGFWKVYNNHFQLEVNKSVNLGCGCCGECSLNGSIVSGIGQVGVGCSMEESGFLKSRPMRILDYGICTILSLFSCYFCPFKTCWNAPCHSSVGLNPYWFGFHSLVLRLVFGLADQDARKRAKCWGQYCNVINGQLGHPVARHPFQCPQQSTLTSTPRYRKLSRWPFPLLLANWISKKRTQTSAVQMHFAYLGKVLQLFQNCKLGPCHPDTHSHSLPWKTSAQTTIFSPYFINFFGSHLSITVKQARKN